MMSESTGPQSRAELVDAWQPYFLAEYDRDECNRRKQTPDEYWSWVKNLLLDGGSGFKGWMEQVEELAEGVKNVESRQRLRVLLYRVGRLVAAEWAKDSTCRKMFSTPWQGRPNLMELGRRLQRAAARDKGDGAAIELAVAEAEAELIAAFRK
jgi:hypothetical protein